MSRSGSVRLEKSRGTSGICVVQLGGLEPPTSCSTDRRSNQLSYNCILAGPWESGSPNGRKLGATPVFGKAGAHAKQGDDVAQMQKALAPARAFLGRMLRRRA